MKKLLLSLVMLAFASGTVAAQDATAPAPAPATAPAHKLVKPAEIKWGDPPAVFRKGMSFAVISGDPGKEGLYVVRAKVPAGYKIMPHWHPGDEHVTVLSGTFALGMGEKFDAATMTKLPAGGYALLPAEMRHYAMATTACVIQVHGMGPFALTYVNPEDDPSKAAMAK
jgi:quercetin dioxygenase-like cupin family protein